MKRPIVTDINILRKVSVNADHDEINAIIKDLEDSLDLSKGIGLSAIQIGIAKRISIIRIGDININLINAEIIEKADRFRFKNEGCLSLSGLKVDTIRYNKIKINNNGEIKDYTGLVACACQHELQHELGRLIIDKGIIWRNIK